LEFLSKKILIDSGPGLKRLKTRTQTTAFDKLKVDDFMKAFHGDLQPEEENHVDFTVLDNYANEIRRRTPLTQYYYF